MGKSNPTNWEEIRRRHVARINRENTQSKTKKLNYTHLTNMLRQQVVQHDLAIAMFNYLSAQFLQDENVIERTQAFYKSMGIEEEKLRMTLDNTPLQDRLKTVLKNHFRNNQLEASSSEIETIIEKLIENIDETELKTNFKYTVISLQINHHLLYRDLFYPEIHQLLAIRGLEQENTSKQVMKGFSSLPFNVLGGYHQASEEEINKAIKNKNYMLFLYAIPLFLARIVIDTMALYAILSFPGSLERLGFSLDINSSKLQTITTSMTLLMTCFLNNYRATAYFAAKLGLCALGSNRFFGTPLNIDFSPHSAMKLSLTMLGSWFLTYAHHQLTNLNANQLLKTEEASELINLLSNNLDSSQLKTVFASDKPEKKKNAASQRNLPYTQVVSAVKNKKADYGNRSLPFDQDEKETAPDTLPEFEPEVIYYKGKKFETGPTHPHIALPQQEEKQEGLRLTRYSMDPKIWFVQSLTLLQTKCGLTEEEASDVTRSRNYQDGKPARYRFGCAGFIDMKQDSPSRNAFKYKKPQSNLAGKWPMFTPVEEDRDDNRTIYEPNGTFKH